jgi:sigma-B regulation protein RsbU (phosphoserine phosphatase)
VVSKEGEIRQLENKGGVFLGAVKNIEYDSNMVNLQPGDTLFLYTDGVTEAMNQKDEMFQEKRLEATLKQNCSQALDAMVETVFKEVQDFAQGVEQFDDITCVVLRYLSQ